MGISNMLGKQQKTHGTKKTDSNKVSDLVAKVFNDFAESSSEFRTLMKDIKIENVTEFKYEDNKTFLLVNVNEAGAKNLQRVHIDLVKRLESTTGKPVIVIPQRKTVDGKKFRSYIGKKVPRTRTLTYVRENLLKDLVDSVDKDHIQSKTSAICVGYKSLTGHELS